MASGAVRRRCLAALPANAAFLQGEALDSAASVLALVVHLHRADRRDHGVLDRARAAGEDRAQASSSATRRDPHAVHLVAGVRRVCSGRSRSCGPTRSPCCTSSPTAGTSTMTITPSRGTPASAAATAAPACNPPAPPADRRGALRGNVERMLANGGTPEELTALRDQLAALEPRIAAQRRRRAAAAGEGVPLMEILLLGIYSFFVWLIFIKFKLLPWNTYSQVTVVVIPIVGMTAMILLLNINAPSSHDVRVFKYTVPIVSQVRGRVIEVPIEEGNRLVQHGRRAVQGRSDAVSVHGQRLPAQLVGAEGGAEQLREQLASAAGNTAALRVANRPRAQAREAEPRARDVRCRQPVRPRASGVRPREPPSPARSAHRERSAGAGAIGGRRRRRHRVDRADQSRSRQRANGSSSRRPRARRASAT